MPEVRVVPAGNSPAAQIDTDEVRRALDAFGTSVAVDAPITNEGTFGNGPTGNSAPGPADHVMDLGPDVQVDNAVDLNGAAPEASSGNVSPENPVVGSPENNVQNSPDALAEQDDRTAPVPEQGAAWTCHFQRPHQLRHAGHGYRHWLRHRHRVGHQHWVRYRLGHWRSAEWRPHIRKHPELLQHPAAGHP